MRELTTQPQRCTTGRCAGRLVFTRNADGVCDRHSRHPIPTPIEVDAAMRDVPISLLTLEQQRQQIAERIDELLLAFDGDTAEALSEAQAALESFGDLLSVAITSSRARS